MAKKADKSTESSYVSDSSKATGNSYNSGGEDVVTIELQSLIIPIAILLGSIIISVTIFFSIKEFGGVGSKGSTTLGAQDTVVDTGAPSPDEFPAMTASISNSPILGDKSKAKVAVIEFSDYECPFCQRHWAETHPKLIQEYVNSGDIIIVYRELPLTSLHPNATIASQAALCARDQKGDKGYYEYHDAIFGGTIAGRASYTKFAENLGLNISKFDSCVDSEKFADQIADDAAAAASLGIGGTPGFIVGLLDDDGNVTGVNIGGAYPFETFAQFIDQYLAEVN